MNENVEFNNIFKLFSDSSLIHEDGPQTLQLMIKKFGASTLLATLRDTENRDAIFQLFSELINKDDKQIMEVMLNKLGAEYIANNFSKNKKLLFDDVLIDLMIIVANKEYNAILHHIEDYPIHIIPAEKLSPFPLLQELHRLKTDLSKLQVPPEAEIVFGDHSNISLDQLFTSFDKINFTEPDQPGYVPPSTCSDDGKLEPPAHFRKGLETLINERIAKLEEYTAVPKDPNERAAWYAQLEKLLKEVIRLSEENPF